MRYRFCLLGFLLIFLSTGAASASDNSQFVPIGYSPDGRFFSYEEYGASEKSRLAYSHIYVIDLVQNKWILGTPVMYMALRPSETLNDVRKRTATQAEMILSDLDISVPAQIIAMIGDGELEVDRSKLLFGVPDKGTEGTIVGNYLLELKSFEAAAASPCWQWFGKKPLGFSVTMENFGGTLEIYKDGVLPRSRGCPFEYRFSAVIMPFGASDISNSLVMLAAFTYGLEEINKQYLAVPLGFKILGKN
ncbi:hypothetical protein MNBD_ALPHA12-600 [hydrothermal vent metagenome]|uniref:DUF2259 domain-containing protein n=1 Tax=hydrothermal vent metagenome TaxID=652676 RepID=A0A3B0U247_9ZZZZ